MGIHITEEYERLRQRFEVDRDDNPREETVVKMPAEGDSKSTNYAAEVESNPIICAQANEKQRADEAIVQRTAIWSSSPLLPPNL